MDSFIEKQPWGTTSYTIEEGSHIHLETKRASVDLITNPFFKRMLFIDGILQSSTHDEQLYHKEIVESALGESAKRVCIAGGAEGATLREVIRLDKERELGVKEIVMVDWDEELVNHMKSEPWSQGSFEDTRLKLLHDDIFQFMNTNTDPFDSFILDLLDPQTEDEVEWLQSIIKIAYKHLSIGGKICVNVGGRFKSMNDIRKWCVSNILSNEVGNCVITQLFVPSFMEQWYLLSIYKAE